MEAVSNTTVLVLLSRVGELRLLELFDILIPSEVYDELFFQNQKYQQSQDLLRKMKFEVIKPKIIISGLDKGECAALSLAIERRKIFLSDDNKARNVGLANSLEVIGTAGVLLLNVQHNKITKKDALIVLDKLVENGYYLSRDLYEKIRKLIDNSA